MATTTPNYGWPVPTSTDLVKDGATAIEALGDAIDATVFAQKTGLTLIKSQAVGTTVASVNVTGAFSATYDSYRIVYSNGISSATMPIDLKLGASVTGYSGVLVYATYTTSTTLIACFNNGSSWPYAGGGDSNGTGAIFDLINPGVAKYTFIRNSNYANATESGFFAGVHKVATAYTDFTLAVSGTLTGGTISVYGYNK
jgi:hypothetical protein